MFRIDQVAEGGDHDPSGLGNGTWFIALALFFMLWIMYTAFQRNSGVAIFLLVPILFFSYIFYYWLFDGYRD